MPEVPRKRRPRHPVKELEVVLREAESRGWRVEKRQKGNYFKLLCPCPEKHMRWVHLTPSGSNYETDLRHWLRRCGCWGEEER
jgi:hypothetical protein